MEDTDRLRQGIRSLAREVGNTPVHEIRHLYRKPGVRIFAKKEWLQLSGSVKARAAYAILRAAIESGALDAGTRLLDATSGNTGIAYATLGKRLGIPVTLCLPENASKERKEILRDLGAELILTSRFEGTDGAQTHARRLAEENPALFFYADQYKNNNNWLAHFNSTGPEILNQVPGITHFIAGLGTTGSFIGTGRRLREDVDGITLISLQPDRPLHGLEGWKHLETAVVPAFYDDTVADENWEIPTEEAYDLIKPAREQEGLALSPSSAANLAGAIRLAERIESGTIVTLFPDNADKYSEALKNLR